MAPPQPSLDGGHGQVSETAPTLDSLEPTSVTVHASTDPRATGIVLTLRGTGFGRDTQVTVPALDDSTGPRAEFAPTTISPGQLQIRIGPEWLTRSQLVAVRVRSNGYDSNELPLELRSPLPTITRVVWQGGWNGPAVLMIYGQEFVEGAEILWNGRAFGTRVAPPDFAEASLLPQDIDGVPCVVAVRNPGPGNQTSNTLTCPTKVFAKKIVAGAYQLVADTHRKRFYASNGTSLLVIDPDRPETLRTIPVESGALALTGDQRHLYVGGVGKIRRLDLETETVDFEWALEPNAFGNPTAAEHISVAPTLPGRVAVTLTGPPDPFRPLRVFEDGTATPTPPCRGCGIHSFSDDSTLHAFNNHDTAFDQYRFTVSPTAVTERMHLQPGAAGFVDQLAVDVDRLLVGTHGPSARAERVGQALDIATGREVARFTGSRTICADRLRDRLYMADDAIEGQSNTKSVWVSDLSDQNLVYTFEVWGVDGGFPGDLARWGERGLALTGRQEGVFLFDIPDSPWQALDRPDRPRGRNTGVSGVRGERRTFELRASDFVPEPVARRAASDRRDYVNSAFHR